MFQFQGIWLPEGEAHFQFWMAKHGQLVDGKGTYQYKKFQEAMRWCKNFRNAVDVGGHVGLWSRVMARRFDHVDAFEPVPAFRECFEKNLADVQGVTLYNCALGAVPGKVRMVTPTLDSGIDSGGTHVDATAADGGNVELMTLDSLCFSNVDFIKVDCEGYEEQVLRGAQRTLQINEPCVIVEQKPHKLGPNFGIKGTPAVDYLQSLGAKVRKVMSGDYILSWD